MKILSKERLEKRLPQLKLSLEQLQAKIEANPKHPRVKDYKNRCKEYEQSIANIEKHGAEIV